MRSRLPSRPPSQPPPYRQLGSGGHQPVRLQLILGLIVGLVLVAVPLYLWRRPQQSSGAALAGADAGAAIEGGAPFLANPDAGRRASNVKLSPFTVINCKDPGPGKTPPERCDHVTDFEDMLARAIRESPACAPKTKSGAMMSFLLEINFRRKRLKLTSGKSSTLPKARSRALVSCVKRALPAPEWAIVAHQHASYLVNVKATYPPSETFQ